MKFCADHWTQLREAIKARGLDGLVATSGEQAAAQMLDQAAKHMHTKTNFDPLMAAHNAILSRSLDMVGAVLLFQNEDGSEKCPICFIKHLHDQDKANCKGCLWDNPVGVHDYWINGPADAVLREAVKLGLVASS